MHKQIFEEGKLRKHELEIKVRNNYSELFIFVIEVADLNSALAESWSNLNMLQLFSAKYHFNKVDTTVNKATTALLGFWNEKISTFNTTSSLKKKSKDFA